MIEKKIFEMNPIINSYKDIIKRGQVSEKIKQEFTKLANEYSDINKELEDLKRRINEIDYIILNSDNGMIIASKKVYPGVKIDIGCYTQYVREEYAGIKFCVVDSQLITLDL